MRPYKEPFILSYRPTLVSSIKHVGINNVESFHNAVFITVTFPLRTCNQQILYLICTCSLHLFAHSDHLPQKNYL